MVWECDRCGGILFRWDHFGETAFVPYAIPGRVIG